MSQYASQQLRDEAFKRAGGRCECEMTVCGHSGRCSAVLRGPWELHRRKAGGPYELGNVIAMCQTCHRNTRTYGVGAR